MGGLSIWHWLIVLVVVMLLFGTGKVSNLMGEFGKGIKVFKQNVASDDDETKSKKDEAMSELSAPGTTVSESQKTTVNQG
jgi:sec-independent protein translocase protein TatA